MPHTNRNRYKTGLRQREAQPLAQTTKKGVIILCPFCKPTHPITPGVPMPCGSILKVTVVQTVIPAHFARKEGIVCMKCGETGAGELAPYQSGYIHVKDCNPNIRIVSTPPRFSKAASLIARLPGKLRATIERGTGHAQPVHEVTPEGKETGKILGYYFARRQKASA